MPMMRGTPADNHGNYIVRLGNLVAWLGEQAEEMGVEVYAGYGAVEILHHEDGSVKGVATNDVGVAKDGSPKPTFERGMELHAKATLFAEGCRGSLTKELMGIYGLAESCEPQTYGIGLKELWRVDPAKHKPGRVEHTVGWPMDNNTWGGSFLYHLNETGDTLVSATSSVRPTRTCPFKTFHSGRQPSRGGDLSPFAGVPKMEDPTPSVRPRSLRGRRAPGLHGARALNEGGCQCIPKLTFPGGALIGCGAGFLNVPKIKGTHTAMKSGMVAAEYAPLTPSTRPTRGGGRGGRRGRRRFVGPVAMRARSRARGCGEELKPCATCGRSAHSPLGMYGAGRSTLAVSTTSSAGASRSRSRTAGSRRSTAPQAAAEARPIEYPKPDNEVSFDLLSSVALTGTDHEGDQPPHLTLRDDACPSRKNLAMYGGPRAEVLPGGRLRVHQDEDDGSDRLQINAQNCIHCKTCDIKCPSQNIDWVVPEGGGGRRLRRHVMSRRWAAGRRVVCCTAPLALVAGRSAVRRTRPRRTGCLGRCRSAPGVAWNGRPDLEVSPCVRRWEAHQPKV